MGCSCPDLAACLCSAAGSAFRLLGNSCLHCFSPPCDCTSSDGQSDLLESTRVVASSSNGLNRVGGVCQSLTNNTRDGSLTAVLCLRYQQVVVNISDSRCTSSRQEQRVVVKAPQSMPRIAVTHHNPMLLDRYLTTSASVVVSLSSVSKAMY